MKPSEVLRAAQALIEPPGAWCKDAYAEDINGDAVIPDSKYACSWCITGVVYSVDSSLYRNCFSYLRDALPNDFRGLIDFNDDDATTQSDVIALFERAIAAAEMEGE